MPDRHHGAVTAGTRRWGGTSPDAPACGPSRPERWPTRRSTLAVG